MNHEKVKLTCVMRRDLRNSDGHKIPKGKLMAQAGHAYVGAVLQNQNRSTPYNQEVLNLWLKGSFFKIALGVDSEAELLEIYEEAKKAGLNVVLITDAGHTEFEKPTITCIGIGPDYERKINQITSKLRGY